MAFSRAEEPEAGPVRIDLSVPWGVYGAAARDARDAAKTCRIEPASLHVGSLTAPVLAPELSGALIEREVDRIADLEAARDVETAQRPDEVVRSRAAELPNPPCRAATVPGAQRRKIFVRFLHQQSSARGGAPAANPSRFEQRNPEPRC